MKAFDLVVCKDLYRSAGVHLSLSIPSATDASAFSTKTSSLALPLAHRRFPKAHPNPPTSRALLHSLNTHTLSQHNPHPASSSSRSGVTNTFCVRTKSPMGTQRHLQHQPSVTGASETRRCSCAAGAPRTRNPARRGAPEKPVSGLTLARERGTNNSALSLDVLLRTKS